MNCEVIHKLHLGNSKDMPVYIYTWVQWIPSRNGNTSSGRICPRNKFIAKELVSDTRLSIASALVLIPATHCQYLQKQPFPHQTRIRYCDINQSWCMILIK